MIHSKKIGPTPVGGEILVKVQISVAIMQLDGTRGSTNVLTLILISNTTCSMYLCTNSDMYQQRTS
jgi:hypothetical protein